MENGEIHSNSMITSRVPATAPTPYLIRGDNGGIVSANLNINIGWGETVEVSPNSNWRLENYSQTVAPITFLKLKELAKLSYLDTSHLFTLNVGGTGTFKSSLNDLTSGVWQTRDNPLNIDSPQVISGNKHLVIFVGKDTNARNLKIQENITITDDSTIVFIVSGTITVYPEVTEIHGIYYSAGLSGANPGIHTGTSSPANDQQLVVYGSLIAGPSAIIYLERDLGQTQNKLNPAELIIFQPRYFLKPLAQYFRPAIKSWEEVAP